MGWGDKLGKGSKCIMLVYLENIQIFFYQERVETNVETSQCSLYSSSFKSWPAGVGFGHTGG